MSSPSLGIFLPTHSHPGDSPGDVVAAARHAEQLGFESAWSVDQLVAGTGFPMLESTVALAAAAGATSRIKLAFGVMILPLRSPVWVAKQVATLQQVSGGRVILGVGAGGDRHALSWAAAGVPRAERGRRTDDALRVLPDLIAGRPVALHGMEAPPVQLSPGAPVPPISVGGVSDAAMRRAVEFGDDWFLLPMPPDETARAVRRLRTLAAERGRPVPTVTASLMVALDGDPALPSPDAIRRSLTDPDGPYEMPAEVIPQVITTGPATAVADRLREFAEAGVQRVVFSVAAGDWHRQAELLAEVAAR